MKVFLLALPMYIVIMLQLLLIGAIASMITTFFYVTIPSIIAQPSLFFSMTFLVAFKSFFMGPITALPFFLTMVCPFLCILEFKKINLPKIIVSGIIVLSIIFPFFAEPLSELVGMGFLERRGYYSSGSKWDFNFRTLFTATSAIIAVIYCILNNKINGTRLDILRNRNEPLEDTELGG